MLAVLENDPLGAGDAAMHRLRDCRRSLVIATTDNQRRHADLSESIYDPPVLEGSGHMEFTWSPHRAIDFRANL